MFCENKTKKTTTKRAIINSLGFFAVCFILSSSVPVVLGKCFFFLHKSSLFVLFCLVFVLNNLKLDFFLYALDIAFHILSMFGTGREVRNTSWRALPTLANATYRLMQRHCRENTVETQKRQFSVVRLNRRFYVVVLRMPFSP